MLTVWVFMGLFFRTKMYRNETLDLLVLQGFLPFVISSFSLKNKGAPGPTPRSATAVCGNNLYPKFHSNSFPKEIFRKFLCAFSPYPIQ